MKYDDIYHTNCSYVLESGIEVTLDSIYQVRTYEGLMLGRPNKWANDHKLKLIIDEAEEKQCYNGVKPYIVEPQRRPYPGAALPPDYESKPDEEWLPQITCIARFHSLYTKHDADYTAMCIIWFQHSFEIDARQMHAVNWVENCHAMEW